MILGVRTDTPVAHIALADDGGHELQKMNPELGRAMAKELLGKIEALLATQNANWQSLEGIVVYKGPGSFTGLRIGTTTANALAYGLGVPIVGEVGDDWLAVGVQRLLDKNDDKIITPDYGADATITTPRK